MAKAFYQTVRSVVVTVAVVVFRARLLGRERVPTSGAYLVAPTHRSMIDVPVVAMITRRRLRFLSKQEVMGGRITGWALGALGGIPVARGTADRSALRACQQALESGEPVVLFPEGTRGSGPQLQELFDGLAYLALKLGLPIVPVGIAGTEAVLGRGRTLPRWSRITVAVGRPVHPPPGASVRRRADLSAVTLALRDELQECFTTAQDANARRGSHGLRRRDRVAEGGERP